MFNSLIKASNKIVWRIIQTKIFDGIRPRIYHTHVFLLRGKTKRSKYELSTLVFAKKEIAHYFSRFYSEEPDIQDLGKTNFHKASAIIEEKKPDIVFAAANRILSNFFLDTSHILLPQVDFCLDISGSWDSIYANIHRGKQKSIRKIQAANYSYEISNDHEKLHWFYNEMYLPNILNKHGDSSETVSFAESTRLFSNGGLFLVKLNDKYVSGATYVIEGDTIYIPMLSTKYSKGFPRGNNRIAALYLIIMWAKQRGYKEINYGSCKPFLKDPTLQYKREWGMRMNSMEGNDARIFALKICNFLNGTIDFLSDTPFVFKNGKDLEGLIFLVSNTRVNKQYYVSGLSRLVILNPTSNLANIQNTQLQKLSSNEYSGQFSTIGLLLEQAAKKGYEAYSLGL